MDTTEEELRTSIDNMTSERSDLVRRLWVLQKENGYKNKACPDCGTTLDPCCVEAFGELMRNEGILWEDSRWCINCGTCLECCCENYLEERIMFEEHSDSKEVG